MTDAATTVRALLDAAQLKVNEEEFEAFVKLYPAFREAVEAMYLPETRYEEPALSFDPSWTDLP
jgi:hypothetical protein